MTTAAPIGVRLPVPWWPRCRSALLEAIKHGRQELAVRSGRESGSQVIAVYMRAVADLAAQSIVERAQAIRRRALAPIGECLRLKGRAARRFYERHIRSATWRSIWKSDIPAVLNWLRDTASNQIGELKRLHNSYCQKMAARVAAVRRMPFELLECRAMLATQPAPIEPAERELLDWVNRLNAATRQANERATTARELFVFDAGVEDYGVLVRSLKESDSAGNIETLVVPAGQDGLASISAKLEQMGTAESVHIVSHGHDGAFTLGGRSIGDDLQPQQAAEIQSWAKHLTPDADILLYGCDVAQDDAGKAFVNHFARLSGADVAASTDLTGSSALGGDWNLEYQTGPIASSPAFATTAYNRVLLTHTGAWTITGGGSGATNTTAGLTTTFTLTADSGTSNLIATGNDTLNNIAAFTPAAGGDPSLVTSFYWDTSPEGSTTEASVDGQTATLTITFSRPVTDPVFNVDRVGGSDSSVQTSAILTLLTPGITLARLSGTPHFAVDAGAGTITNNQVDVPYGGGYSAQSSMTANLGTAAGSVQLNGTFTTVSFRLAAAPNSNEGAGSDAIEMAFEFNATPTVATPAAATPSPVPGNSTSLSVLGADDGGEGNLTYTWATTGTPPAAVVFSANGTNAAKNSTATFTKAGSYDFQVTITDPEGLSTTSDVTVTVNQTLTSITVAPGTVTLNETQTQQFGATAYDQFGTALISQPGFTWSKTAGIGSINGTGLYTAPSSTGTATVTATSGAVSGNGSITVTNTAPAITSNGGGATAAISIPENTIAVTTVTATDADVPAQTLTYSISGGADAGKFSINGSTGVLAFQSAPNYESPTDANSDNVYNVTVQVADGGGGTDTQAISVTVTPVNDNSPAFTSPTTASVPENTTAVMTVAATDADLPAQTLTYSISGGADAGKFTINGSTGVLAFQSAPDYENPADANTDNVYSLQVTADDGNGSTTTQSISVTVAPTNDNSPVITSNGGAATAAVSIPENTTGVTTVTATDADLPAQTLSYSISGGADAGKFSINSSTGVLSFQSAPNYETPTDANGDNVYDVTVQASDGAGGTDTQAVSVTVTPVNDNTPVITSDGGGAGASTSIPENTTGVTTVAATDADLPAPTLTYSISGGADAGRFSVNSSTGVLSFLAAPNYEAPTDANSDNVYDVIVRVSDGSFSDTQAISVTVTPVNDNSPAFTSPTTASVPENTTAVMTVTATDADLPSQTLTYSISGGADAGKFTINGSTGVLAFQSAPDYENPADANTDNVYSLQVTADDGNGRTTTQSISVTVTPVNETPTVASGAAATPSPATGTTTDLSVLGADDGGEAGLVYTWATTGTLPAAVVFSANGTNAAKNTTATFTQAGTYDFQVTISDGALSTTSSVSVVVSQTVTSIAVSPATVTIVENTQLQFNAEAYDQFGDVVAVQPSFTWAVAAGIGSVNGSGLYTAPPVLGSATITASAGLASGSASVNVVAPSTGTLTGSGVNTNALVDLTAVGTGDWIHWGLGSVPGTDRKSTGGSQISDVSISNGNVSAVSDLPRPMKWTDGTPDVSRTDTAGHGTGLKSKTNQTLSFTAPADTAPRTLLVYVGSKNNATGTFTAHLSDGSAPDFVELTALNDTGRTYTITYSALSAGQTLTISWTRQTGEVTLSGAALVNQAPVIVNGAAATPSPVTGTTTDLSALGADDGGEANLTYTWATTGTPPAAVVFSANGTNAAKNSTATFTKAGTYDFQVTIADPEGLSTTSDVTVTVNQTLTSIAVAPGTVTLNETQTQQFGATAYDQFGTALISQPGFTWSKTAGIGSINGTGLYTAPLSTGTATVTATSGAVSGNGSITVTNTAPAITSNGGGAAAAISIPENTIAVTTVTATDADVPAQTLTYSISGGADAGKFSINGSTGVLAFQSSPNYESPTDANSDNVYNVTVQVSDGGGGTDTQAISVTVTPVNDNSPVITSDGGGASAAVSIPENTTAITTVTATDADLPAQTLTYSISGGADAGKFAIDSSTGALSFSSAPNYEAPTDANADNVYDVTVQVSDGSLTATQVVSVTVTPVNDNSPVIASDGGGATAAISVAENTTGVTTVAATDADLPAQTLSYSIGGGADAGKFTINSSTGVLTFQSAPNYEAPTDANSDNVYEVTVQVSDGSLTDTQAISVTVTPVNDNTPVITSDGGGASAAISIAENTTAVTTVTATDADLPAQTLTYSISGGADAGKFAVNSSTGALSFSSAPNYEAPTDANADNVYDLTVQVSDGSFIDTQAISVTVTPVNDNTPVITSDGGGATAAISVAENTTGVTTVTATDADLPAQAMTYTISGGADAGKFNINSSTGVLSFLAAPDFEAPTDANSDNVYDVTVQVSDGGLTATQAISVIVTPVNDNTPVITSDGGGASAALSIAENTSAVTTVTGSDADLPAETLTFSIVGGADAGKFTIDASTGALQFVAAPNREAPTDANGDNVYDVTVQLSDGTNAATQALSVTVNDVNESGVGAISDADGATDTVAENTPAGTTVGITASATDPDATNSSITYSLDDDASGLFAIDAATGVVTVAGAIDREAAASRSITVRATSADGSFSTRTFSIAIGDVNEFSTGAVGDGDPAADAVDENAANGTPVGVTVSATDPDATNSAITYSLDDNAGGRFTIDGVTGVVTVADGALLDREAAASHTITARATSQDGSYSTQTFTIAVNAVNDNTPVIDSNGGGSSAAVSIAENSVAVTTVAGTDADVPADTLTYSIVGGADAAKFTIDASTGALSFVTAPDREAPTDADNDNIYDVIVQLSDGIYSDSQTLAVTVTDVNEFSVGAVGDGDAGADEVAENSAIGTLVGITATATDADATNSAITYSLDDSAGGRFAIDAATGVVTVAGAIDREAAASYTIAVRATSDDGSFSTHSFTIGVLPVNDNSPAITSNGGGAAASINIAENSTAVATVQATDADLPAQALTYSISGGADAALFDIDSATGALSFRAAPDYENPADANGDNVYAVVVQASDGAFTATQTLTVTVAPVNDNAPTITSDGGGATAVVNVAENTTAVTTVTATDADLPAQTLTYSISGGADAAKFTINAHTGVLSFAQAPNYEVPTDANGDNVYDVVVQVSDGSGGTGSQALAVHVTNRNEAPLVHQQTFEISDRALAGEFVGTIQVVDPDGDPVRFTIVGGQGGQGDHGPFRIDANTGQITLTEAAVGYAGSTIVLHVRVSDRTTPGIFADLDVRVQITRSYLISMQDEPKRRTSGDGGFDLDLPGYGGDDGASSRWRLGGDEWLVCLPISYIPDTDGGKGTPDNTTANKHNAPAETIPAAAPDAVAVTPQGLRTLHGPLAAAPLEPEKDFDQLGVGGPVKVKPIKRLEWSQIGMSQMPSDAWTKLRLRVGLVSALGAGVASAYLFWLIRGASLLGSFLSSIPLWRFIDPLFVLPRKRRSRRKSRQLKKKDGVDAPEEKLFR